MARRSSSCERPGVRSAEPSRPRVITNGSATDLPRPVFSNCGDFATSSVALAWIFVLQRHEVACRIAQAKTSSSCRSNSRSNVLGGETLLVDFIVWLITPEW